VCGITGIDLLYFAIICGIFEVHYAQSPQRFTLIEIMVVVVMSGSAPAHRGAKYFGQG